MNKRYSPLCSLCGVFQVIVHRENREREEAVDEWLYVTASRVCLYTEGGCRDYGAGVQLPTRSLALLRPNFELVLESFRPGWCDRSFFRWALSYPPVEWGVILCDQLTKQLQTSIETISLKECGMSTDRTTKGREEEGADRERERDLN